MLGGASTTKTILFAVLDWGLGHATRSLPIIRHLLALGHQVLIASSGRALVFLQEAFPECSLHKLPAYDFRYDKRSMTYNVLRQGIHVLQQIQREHQYCLSLDQHHHIHAVISDNRYGCWLPEKPSVILTHQTHPIAPPGIPQRAADWMIHRWLSRFTECWVPDSAPTDNLTGPLSRPVPGLPTRYLGPVSRAKSRPSDPIYRALVILSGPEPQRTYLEKKLLDQMQTLPGPFALVRGASGHLACPGHIAVFGLVNSPTLNQLVGRSRAIISRPGYSTIMDLGIWQKPAILIPTPGQTEQEWLAGRLRSRKAAVIQNQEHLDLALALANLDDVKPGVIPTPEPGRWQTIVRDWVQSAHPGERLDE